jgi:DNA helicase-2/ATP-dependent DNA helicase PcrA
MDILNGLNKEQYEAVTHVNGPLLIIAGAGSGKTRALTHRIAYLIGEQNIKPWNIIAITFTNKAAKEMKGRVEHLIGEAAKDMWIGTFHSMCVRILRRDIDKLGYNKDFIIFDTSDSKVVIKDCIKELNLNDKVFNEKYLLNEISKAKNDMIDPTRYSNMYSSNFTLGKVAEAYSLYQSKLKKNNAVDFDDIIDNTIKLFNTNADVLDYYQTKFEHVLVDEFQDTNKAQNMLVSMLAGKHKNICVVGDDQQSIYKFRGADITNILSFEKSFPDARIIKLEQNYRSTKNILNAANGVIKNNLGNVKKNLWTENDEGKKPIFYKANDEYDEGRYIVEQINYLKREEYYKYKDFAVLYRTNAQSRAIEAILAREGVPYRIVGGLKFYDRKEIKDIMAYIRLVYNPSDDLALKRIINEPKRGIGKTTLDGIEKIANENNISMFEVIKNADKNLATRANESIKEFCNFILEMQKDTSNIMDLTVRILDKSGYRKALEQENTVEAESRLQNLDEFLTVTVEFEEQAVENPLAEFLENLALVSDLDEVDDTADAITLMTLHTAKGLEFPVVFMTGMEDGLFPSYRSIAEEAEVEEERRLCYVGITRAKHYLYLTCAKSRTIFGSTSYSIPSRFIGEIPKEYIDGVEEKIKEPKVKEWHFEDLPSEKKAKEAFSFRTAESFLSKVVANEDVDLSAFRVGIKVAHKKFGEGIIVNVEPEDDDLKVEIEFEKAGMKRLMAKFAHLEIIE